MQTLIEKLGKNNFIFLGLPSEYEYFCKQITEGVEYLRTSNLLQAARAINTTSLYIGNQSCLLAIAEALKIETICEGCCRVPNCNFSMFRNNFWYGFTEKNGNIHFINNTNTSKFVKIRDMSLIKQQYFTYSFID